MKKYKVETTWSGYSRGEAAYIIEAETKEEAGELFYEGEVLYFRTIRDDTESEVESIEIIT